MSLARHCVPEELLFAYAAGSLPEAAALVVATHLALCPDCRGHVAELESVAGALLAEAPVAPIDDGLLDRTLARLDESVPTEPKRPPPSPELARIPEPLRTYMGGGSWRWMYPGVEQLELSLKWGDEPVRVARLQPGTVIPRHTHVGLEIQCVLTGGYTDATGHYTRGAFQLADADLEHELAIDPGEACITIVAKQHRLVPRTAFGRLAAWWIGM